MAVYHGPGVPQMILYSDSICQFHNDNDICWLGNIYEAHIFQCGLALCWALYRCQGGGIFLTGNLPLYARRILKWEPLPKKDCSVGPWSMLPFLKAHAKLNVKTTLKFCFLNNMCTVYLWCNQSIRTTPEKKTILLHSLWGDCCFRWHSRNVPSADGPRGGQTLFLLNTLHCLMLHSLSTPCEWANVELATLDFPEGFFDKVFSWALYCEFVLFDEVLYVWKNTTTLYSTMVKFVYSINMVAIYQD